jgi:hypothetical protein
MKKQTTLVSGAMEKKKTDICIVEYSQLIKKSNIP